MDADRRRRTRVNTRIAIDFIPQDGKTPVALAVRNISLKGLLAAPAEALSPELPGISCAILGEDAVIEIESRIVRSGDDGVAIEFLSMDPESFRHLRNLVRFNAADADRIDAELRKPAFCPPRRT